MSAQSDEKLMRRVQAGDERAFDMLLRRHGRAVGNRLAAMLRNDAAVEDLCQEVFLRLWTRCRQWKRQGSLARWLLRIATNLALNHLRSQRRRPQRPLSVPGTEGRDGPQPHDWPDDGAPDPAELLEQAERLESFHRAIDALPEAKRAVVKLVHEDQLDMATVAERLGVPLGTVKSRLHYARGLLVGLWRQQQEP